MNWIKRIWTTKTFRTNSGLILLAAGGLMSERIGAMEAACLVIYAVTQWMQRDGTAKNEIAVKEQAARIAELLKLLQAAGQAMPDQMAEAFPGAAADDQSVDGPTGPPPAPENVTRTGGWFGGGRV